MDSSVSLADIAAVTDRNNGMNGFGGEYGFFWIFALLILPMLWGGGMWGGNRGANGQPVTEAGLCNAMNFNNLENAVYGTLFDGYTLMAFEKEYYERTRSGFGYRLIHESINGVEIKTR